MVSLKQILSEQDTGYTRFLDRQYSTVKGATEFHKSQRELIEKLFARPEFYEVAGMVTQFIPDPRIRIPTTMALELNAARLYYKKGDYVNATIAGVFASLPILGTLPGVKQLTQQVVKGLQKSLSTGTKLTKEQLTLLFGIIKNKSLIKSKLKKFNDFLNVVKKLPKSKNLQKHLDDLISGKINKQQFFDAFKGYHKGMNIFKLGKEWPLQHGSPKKLTVDDLVLKDVIPVDILMRPGKSSKKLALGPSYGPGGFYTTHRGMPGWYGPSKGPSKGVRQYFYSFELKPGSVVLDARNVKNYTMDFINVGSLQQYAKDGFDAIIGKGTVGGYEVLPLNKSAIANWRLQK